MKTDGAACLAILHDSPEFGGHERAFLMWLPALIASEAIEAIHFWIPRVNVTLAKALEPFAGGKVQVTRHDFAKGKAETVLSMTRVAYGLAVRRFVRDGRFTSVLLLQGRIENLATPMTWLPRAVSLVSYIPMAHSAREMGNEGLLGRTLDWLKRRLYGRPNLWVVPAEAVASQLRRAGASAPVRVVENVPSTLKERILDKAFAKAELELSRDKRVALFMGRFDAGQKGLDRLERDLRNAPDTFDEWTFVFVGAGPYEEAIKSLANEGHVDVQVVSWTDRPALYLQAADVLLLPSRFEGVPLVMLEAMRARTPILGSDIDVFREYLEAAALHNFAEPVELRSSLEALTTTRAIEDFGRHAACLMARLDLERSQRAFLDAVISIDPNRPSRLEERT